MRSNDQHMMEALLLLPKKYVCALFLGEEEQSFRHMLVIRTHKQRAFFVWKIYGADLSFIDTLNSSQS